MLGNADQFCHWILGVPEVATPLVERGPLVMSIQVQFGPEQEARTLHRGSEPAELRTGAALSVSRDSKVPKSSEETEGNLRQAVSELSRDVLGIGYVAATAVDAEVCLCKAACRSNESSA